MGCDRGRYREASSVDSGTESGDEMSKSSGEGDDMETSEADDSERKNTNSFWGALHHLLRARTQRDLVLLERPRALQRGSFYCSDYLGQRFVWFQ